MDRAPYRGGNAYLQTSQVIGYLIGRAALREDRAKDMRRVSIAPALGVALCPACLVGKQRINDVQQFDIVRSKQSVDRTAVWGRIYAKSQAEHHCKGVVHLLSVLATAKLGVQPTRERLSKVRRHALIGSTVAKFIGEPSADGEAPTWSSRHEREGSGNGSDTWVDFSLPESAWRRTNGRTSRSHPAGRRSATKRVERDPFFCPAEA
ncbi:hypothetical protein ACWD4O_27030 [Streptomyces sp. NPDC002623]